MGKGIYTYYKERLIEIGGNNRCLYLKHITRKGAYDLGRIFEARDDKVLDFIDFIKNARKLPITVISKGERREILDNLSFYESIHKATEGKTDPKEVLKAKKEAEDRVLERELKRLCELKREVEEIEKETGRYELYVGYPFVFGVLPQGAKKTPIKAPLMLFPVKIELPDENTAQLVFNSAEKIRINPALVFAYAQSKKMNVDMLDLEYDDLSSFNTVNDVIKYLAAAGIKIDYSANSKNIYGYSRFKEPSDKEFAVRSAAVLARFPISNSIYNDYTLLEKKKLTNDAIDELLRMGAPKKKKKPLFGFKKKAKKPEKSASYTIKMLDFAQSEVVKRVDRSGNMVIYGPPGTGKSQTIVNVITDAICKHKRVLVVSQKKAALDVVYNRLGTLNDKAMYINDESKEKRFFYEKCLAMHNRLTGNSPADLTSLTEEYDGLEARIEKETDSLNAINRVLNEKRPFGLSLSEMYASSRMISKTSADYAVYEKLTEHRDIMSMSYRELSEAIFVIKEKNLAKLYYDFTVSKDKNPVIDHLQNDIDITVLTEVKAELADIQKSRRGYFSTAKYPYYRQVMAYFKELDKPFVLDLIVKQERKIKHPHLLLTKKKDGEIREKFNETLHAVKAFAAEYDCLRRVLTEDGYIAVIDNILRGNNTYIKHVYEALNNYIEIRDINKLFDGLDKNNLAILGFAYSASKNYQNYSDIIDKTAELRIYHEAVKYEESEQDDLSKIVDFKGIASRIYKLKEEQLLTSAKITAEKNFADYAALYNEREDAKDYLYQISKKQKFWPIRKTMEVYSDYILSLFPCWLLSPENVSSLLPLVKNLFDVVIFDEASQVFIESTIPTIYRGKNIVVAGDRKQLRPSTTFMKRYLGADIENLDDFALMAALEVESLLDLAVSRYESANLTYHYRSKYSELIDFSNAAFYSSNLQISPNISKNKRNRPIERHLVDGRWIDRKNEAEAAEIVSVLKNIFATRKNNESIGIITFNTDQQSCIADMIDRECRKDAQFRSDILLETHRTENGEDTGMFIKNLENVQGDERDIIIFSIGYAKNEEGKVYTNFGSLSADGGENRLNVAITRAKSKIILVTSIEPEELKIENAKNLGPKLLKKYLMYVRAVAAGDAEEVSVILSELSGIGAPTVARYSNRPMIEDEIKTKLEKLGYTVDVGIGNSNNRISLAVYDKDSDKYLVGVELDRDAFASSKSALERDVYKPKFLESRGWNVMRVWSRDWWLYPHKVIKAIAANAERNK